MQSIDAGGDQQGYPAVSLLVAERSPCLEHSSIQLRGARCLEPPSAATAAASPPHPQVTPCISPHKQLPPESRVAPSCPVSLCPVPYLSAVNQGPVDPSF